MPCPSHCVNSRCHVETGQCFECEDGYQGPMCEQCMHCRLTSSFGIVCLLNVQKYGFCFLRIIFILLKIYHLFYSLYLKRIHCQNYVKGYRESYFNKFSKVILLVIMNDCIHHLNFNRIIHRLKKMKNVAFKKCVYLHAFYRRTLK